MRESNAKSLSNDSLIFLNLNVTKRLTFKSKK